MTVRALSSSGRRRPIAARVAPEHLLPETLTDEDDVVAAGPLLVVREQAAQDWTRAEQRQELGRHAERREPPWLTAPRSRS